MKKIAVFLIFLALGCMRVPTPKDPEILVWKKIEYKKAPDPGWEKQWNLKKIEVEKAWEKHEGSGEIVVALVGTGVDYNHPDLRPNIWVNPGEGTRRKRKNQKDDDRNGFVDDVIGWDFVDWDNKPYDRHGVGTHSAGIIAALKDNGIGVRGIAPNVSLMVLRYIGSYGRGYLFDCIDALEYAINQGVKIIYLNWNFGFADKFPEELKRVFQKAEERGILIVLGAGNQSTNVDTKAVYPASFDLNNLIVVAALDRQDRLAGFSNFGRAKVDLAAPGVEIYSTLPGGEYGYFSGTATAAAHVAGVAALCLSYHAPRGGLEELKRFLLEANRVDPFPHLFPYLLSGGRLNAAKALRR